MIRVGIGGWTYEPWRGGVFYPKALPKTQELAHASRHVTAIEVNGTFYSSQKPETFRRWAQETPDDFVFSLKAPRFAVNRRVLGTAGESIARFVDSGIGELKQKLGPILWQFAATKKYDPEDIAAFLALLPRAADGYTLRHVLEPRHETFVCADFVKQAREANVAIVLADSKEYPLIADPTSDFVYARLQESNAKLKTGYAPKDLDTWAAHAKSWASGKTPKALKLLAPADKASKSRDVFIFFISGAKERNPAAAQALIERVT
jgi:uncharacterized protein YecE (DUF72 family)